MPNLAQSKILEWNVIEYETEDAIIPTSIITACKACQRLCQRLCGKRNKICVITCPLMSPD